MKNITRLAAFALLAALAGALPRAAGAVIIRPNAASSPAGTVPNNVNYQGRLVDNGFPVTGFKNVTFKIYDDLATGTLLQTIGPQLVSVNQGLFSTTIAISTQALAGPLQKYLEVTVGTQKLSPREPLNSVPYALVAKSLEENLAISTVSVGTQLISSGTLAVASIQALNNSTFFTILSNAHMSSSTLTLDGNATTSLTTTGKVGIGTAAPGQLLTLNGGATDTHALLQNNFTGTGLTNGLDLVETTGGAAQIWNYQNGIMQFAVNNAEKMRIDTTGRVGIGVAPSKTLDVEGDAQFGTGVAKSAFSTLGALTLASGIGTTMLSSNGNVVVGGSVTASAFFGDASGLTNVVRKTGDSMSGPLTMVASTITIGGSAFSVSATTFVVTGGNVGINQTAATVAAAPTRLLVGGSISANSFDTNFAGGGNRLMMDFTGGNGRLITVQGGGAGILGTQVQDIYFKAGGSGFTGFGTTSPTQRIHVSSGTILVDGNTANSIITSGRVGIGGTPTNPLSVTGNADVSGTLTAGSFSGPISGNASSANNLSGGSTGVIPFQTGSGATSFTSAGTSGQVLTSAGAVVGGPGWTTATNANTFGAIVQRDGSGNFSAGTISAALSGNATTATTATNLAGGAANQIPVQSGGGATTFVAAPGVNSVLFGNSGAPSWTNAPTLTGTNFSSIPNGALSNSAVTVSAGSGLSGGGAVSLGGSTSLSLNVGNSNTWTAAQLYSAAIGLFSQSKAQLSAVVPTAVGQVYFCNNCLGAVGATGKIVVSTGTGAGNFADAAGGIFQ